jgi:glycolate dehydrogenase FAD-binding subunit
VTMETPASFADAAGVVREAAVAGHVLRPRGGGTKLAWGASVPEPDLELSTAGLRRIREHNEGDLTAVVEAGVPLAEAQAAFAEAGQMLGLDPPLGDGARATVGGIVATGDSGPLRHRYGGARDLLLGLTVVLSDGTVAKSGGKVIKNVAGYDLAKLFAGSFGTLGPILQVVVRLHPCPSATATAAAESDDPAALVRAASGLAHAPLDLESLDLSWRAGRGAVLARFGGLSAEVQAKRAVASLLREPGLETEVRVNDEDTWAEQRAAQRSRRGLVVRVSGLQTELERVMRVADRLGGSVVARAGLGLSWVAFELSDPPELVAAVDGLRRELAPSPCVVLDAPPEVRERVDVWGPVDESLARLMRRVKERFDAHGVCNPGVFAGGL